MGGYYHKRLFRITAPEYKQQIVIIIVTKTLAEKSAAAVPALDAVELRATPHTAPLWPSNVPIQSPVLPCRSIGFPSNREGKLEDMLPQAAAFVFSSIIIKVKKIDL